TYTCWLRSEVSLWTDRSLTGSHSRCDMRKVRYLPRFKGWQTARQGENLVKPTGGWTRRTEGAASPSACLSGRAASGRTASRGERSGPPLNHYVSHLKRCPNLAADGPNMCRCERHKLGRW